MPKRIIPKSEHIFRKRRTRTLFTKKQQTRLEEAFNDDRWPSASKKEKLASELDMTLQSVRTWFQNRRAKSKRVEDWEKMKATREQKTQESSIDKPMSAKEPITQGDTKSSDRSQSTRHFLRSSPAVSAKMSAMFSQKIIRKRLINPVPTVSSTERPKNDCYESDSSESTSGDENQTESEVDSDKNSQDNLSDSVDQNEKENNVETKMKTTGSNGKQAKISGIVPPCMTESDLVIASHAPTVSADIFTSIIDLLTVVEGGIIKPTDPAFNTAANHALYGLRLKDGDTLFCDKECGFYIKNGEEKN